MPLLFTVWLAAAPPEPPGVAEVRETYAVCTALQKTAKPLKYVEIWSADYKTARWMPEPQRDAGEAYSWLAVYSGDKAATFGVLEQTSPSGDWFLVTEYCFRPDGSLALLFATLTTPVGDVKEETRHYFDPSGKELLTRRAVFDRATGKPTQNTQYLQQTATVFRSAKELLELVRPRR